MSDEWKTHPVFTDYQCSPDGQARISPHRKGRGLRTITAGQILTPLERGGLLYVRLRQNAERCDYPLARFVLETFGFPQTAPSATVLHRDGDFHNCCLDNLEWTENPPFPAHLLEPDETAVPLADAPGYFVTSHGRFYARAARRWLRYHVAYGRPTVLLTVESKEVRRAAALLVALHFPHLCGEKPTMSHARVLQKDNDPLNCRADNLTWGSHRELLERRSKDRKKEMEPRLLTRRLPAAPPEPEEPAALSYAMDWLLKQGRQHLPVGDPTTGHVFYYLDAIFQPLCADCAAVRIRRCFADGKIDDTIPVEQIILWPAKPHLGWQAHTIHCTDCGLHIEPGAAKPDFA